MLRSASYVVVQVRHWDIFNCYNHLYLQVNSLLFTSHNTIACMALNSTFLFSHFEENPDRFINKLLSLNPSSTLAQLANGALSWHKKKNSVEASRIISPILERTSNPNFFGVYILCLCLHEIQVSNFRAKNDSII